MFTLDQIKAAHSKVKSGADFPNYIQDLIQLGVIAYETFVADGHAEFAGNQNHKVDSEPKYPSLIISDNRNSDQFKADLKAHQQGKTDYLTFCKDCAKSGIFKWQVNMSKMTCTYFDKDGNEVLTEQIPS
jgi:uncharacterized protein YbcV (DUF1398 family)